MQNKKSVIISIVVLLALFIGGGLYYKNTQSAEAIAKAKENAQALERPHSFVVGNENAKVQLVEFFDPACGTCAQFHPHVKKILKENNGNVKLVLRYAPFHQNSNYAVKMLAGAKEQGKFMETLDFMFKTGNYWIENHVVNPRKLWSILPQVEGLDMEKLGKYMNDPKGDEIIAQDLADAQKLGVDKTPGYIVNGKPLQNFGLQQLKDLINSEL